MNKKLLTISSLVSAAVICAPITSCAKTHIIHVDSVEIDHYLTEEMLPGTPYNFVSVGSSVKLGVKVSPENATDKSVTWTSSDPSIAEVDQEGNVSGIKEGNVTLTAESHDNQKKYNLLFFVYQKEVKPRAVQITSKIPQEADVDGYYDVSATVLPKQAIQYVAWESKDPTVATIESTSQTTAKIHALKEGTTVITAKSYDNTAKQTFVVRVSPVYVNSIEFEYQTCIFELQPGKPTTYQLKPTILPTNATDKSLQWESSDKSVVTVDDNGLVSLVTSTAGSTATITAKAKDAAGVSNKVQVIVVDQIVPLQQIVIDDLELNELTSSQLQVTYTPANATNKNISWHVNDESIAKVNSSGEVTGLREGTTVVSGMPEDETAQPTSCTVTVKQDPNLIQSITLSEEYHLDLNYPQQGVSIDPQILPTTATSAVWIDITNPNIAESSGNKLYPKALGETTFRAISTDKKGVVSKEAKIIVEDSVKVKEITIDQEYFAINLNKPEVTHKATATVLPTYAANPNVHWYSTSEKTVEIDKDTGVLTPKASGVAQIYAIAADGSQVVSKNRANVYVGYYKPVESIVLNSSSLELLGSESEQLTATVKPDDASVRKVYWKSEDPNIATVTAGGLVTGVNPGITNIVAISAEDESITAKCSVTVREHLPTEVIISPASTQIYQNETQQLSATVNPSTASQIVNWYSSHSDIASVDKKTGLVTAKQKGKTTITAEVENYPTVKGTCDVEVLDVYKPVESLTLNLDRINFDWTQETPPLPQTVKATISPSEVTESEVTFSQSKEGIVKVEPVWGKPNQWEIRPLEEGDTVITFTTVGHDAKGKQLSKTLPVSVFKRKVFPTKISVLNKPQSAIPCGNSTLLNVEIKPDDTYDKSYTWSSTNESVAYVDKNSILHTLNTGKAKITVKANSHPEQLEPVTDSFDVDVLNYAEFETCEWSFVISACNDLEKTWNGKSFTQEGIAAFVNKFSIKGKKATNIDDFIGATKKVVINNQEHIVRVIDHTHDNIWDETKQKAAGKTALTFELVTLLSDSEGHAITTQWDSTRNYTYTNGHLHTNLNGGDPSKQTWDKTAYEMLDAELKSGIKNVAKSTWEWNSEGKKGHYVNYPCHLFPLTATEIGSDSKKQQHHTEGTIYRYWNDHNNDKARVMKDAAGTIHWYWLVSPYTDNKSDAWLVEKDGRINRAGVINIGGVSFAFCI